MPDSEITKNGQSPSAGASILIVDDDAQIRQLVAKLLRENGFRVTAATDAREFREALAGADARHAAARIAEPARRCYRSVNGRI